MGSRVIYFFVLLRSCLGIWPSRESPQPVDSGEDHSFLAIAAERIRSAAISLERAHHQSTTSVPTGKSWGMAIPVLAALGFSCGIVAIGWVSSRLSQAGSKTEKEILVKPARKGMMIEWFSLVFLQALLITVIQVLVGVATGSLSLLADAIHGSMDAISYGVGASVELSKSQEKKGSLCDSKRLDFIGATVNIATLLVSSVWVSLEAFGELQHEPEPSTASSFQGPALIGFSLLGLLANVFLLVLFMRWRIGRKVFRPASDDAESCHTHVHQHGESCGHNHGHDHIVDEYEDAIGPASACDIVHALVHPGCSANEACDADNVNLNLNATTLHVVSDCFRSGIVLIAGFLITFSNKLSWASKVDAFGALLITVFNILGALAVMQALFHDDFGAKAAPATTCVSST